MQPCLPQWQDVRYFVHFKRPYISQNTLTLTLSQKFLENFGFLERARTICDSYVMRDTGTLGLFQLKTYSIYFD